MKKNATFSSVISFHFFDAGVGAFCLFLTLLSLSLLSWGPKETFHGVAGKDVNYLEERIIQLEKKCQF